MPVISLGWSLTQCEPAAGEQACLTHCQRGGKPKGLLPAMGRESCLLKKCGMCATYCMFFVCIFVCMDLVWLCVYECVSVLMCTTAWVYLIKCKLCIKLCVYSVACVYNVVPNVCTCICICVHISENRWSYLKVSRFLYVIHVMYVSYILCSDFFYMPFLLLVCLFLFK